MFSAHYNTSTFWHRTFCKRCQHETRDVFQTVIVFAGIAVLIAIAIFKHL